ncbi:MAG TPA: nucleoside triphosphate pyrophosphohydrolase [Candidatus Dormibacteraeota bacterium]|nr:nucleoside triphosphate pyrophosphohydrolase [Candidatus Dormibacteraeota bacterium]
MLVRIVGLGPGDPSLLTVGAIAALTTLPRVVTLLAPPDLREALLAQKIALDPDPLAQGAAIARGSSEAIGAFVASLPDGDIGIAVLGNPFSDFPGLAQLQRALDERGARTEIVPAMARATLAASLEVALVPLPPQSQRYSFAELVAVMARLRSGCPWDREQTHRTLVPYLIEETFEVVEAIEEGGLDALCEELGDLLLQIVFHSQIASESGAFTVADVIDALANKMVRRHPHVFADAIIEDVDAQWRSWEKLKSQEKTGLARESRLDGIPKHLGALQRGQRMQEKAARVGFDWPAVAGILDKLTEELEELAGAQREKNNDAHVREELGDVFFTLVNLSRALGIDAESAVREANEKFYRRFCFMERAASEGGRALADLTFEELEELWQRAKSSAA